MTPCPVWIGLKSIYLWLKQVEVSFSIQKAFG